MSDTPRTSEEWRRIQRLPDGRYSSQVTYEDLAHGMCNFAKQLERELSEARKQRDTLAEIYPLLASAWFYGKWKAETLNEKEMQKIMEREGWYPFESEADLMKALATTKGGLHDA